MVPMDILTTVHDALTNASLTTRAQAGVPVSVRVEDTVKADCSDICRRHGTTITEFLRQCCIGLARDYKGPERKA